MHGIRSIRLAIFFLMVASVFHAQNVFEIRALYAESTGTHTTYNAVHYSADAISIPGRVEMEDYQDYFDVSPGNLFEVEAATFTEDVDVRPTADLGGGYKIADIAPLEWLSYDISVTETNTYTVIARIASDDEVGAKSFQVVFSNNKDSQLGSLVAEPVSTGNWDTFVDLSIGNVRLIEGSHTMTVVMNTGWFDINYIDVVAAAEAVGSIESQKVYIPLVSGIQ